MEPIPLWMERQTCINNFKTRLSAIKKIEKQTSVQILQRTGIKKMYWQAKLCCRTLGGGGAQLYFEQAPITPIRGSKDGNWT